MFWCLKLIVIVCITSSSRVNSEDFFISSQHRNRNYTCVTNSSNALSWIVEDIKETLQQDSTFLPRQSVNNFDHSIKNDSIIKDFVKKPWSLIDAFQTNLTEIILDRRWEHLDIHLTRFAERKDTPSQFVPVLTSLQDNFEIPLSIRSERESHIFLCDGNNPAMSNCYWFMLQAWSGKRSAIRKCSTGQIPDLNERYPGPPCSHLLAAVEHPSDEAQYFSSQKWSHFTLSKRENVLTFAKLNQYGNHTNILELIDNQKPVEVSHMIIHSKQVNGLWKIHNADFIYTKEETKEVQLGPLINPRKNNYVCVSMFVKMCDSCSLKLTLSEHDGRKTTEKNYQSATTRWTEIKWIVNTTAALNKKLLVSTIGAVPGRFWAIDDIRLCQREEVRSIVLSEKASCQLISRESEVISAKTLSKTSKISKGKCPERAMGDFCVPCHWIYDSCHQIKICQKYDCVCSAGYRTTDCHNSSEGNFYGQGCKSECGCPTMIFRNPPETIDVSFFTAKVAVRDFSVEKTVDEEPESYVLQYKKASSSGETSWTYTGSREWFNETMPTLIENLDAGTKYCVRAIIISNKRKSYKDQLVKCAEFTTKCRNISMTDVDIRATNTSANVTIKTDGEKCKLDDNNVNIAPSVSPNATGPIPRLLSPSQFEFTNLEPFTNYVVTFRSNSLAYSTTFRTKEGIPDQIRGYNFTRLSPSKLEIKWPNTTNLRGNFKCYRVKYHFVSHRACGKRPQGQPQWKSLETKKNSIIIEGLVPFSTYNFSISVENTVFPGPPTIKKEKTLPTVDLEPTEIPTIVDIVPETCVSTRVSLSKIPCEQLRGYGIVKAKPDCSTEQRKQENYTIHDVLLDNLPPYTNCTVQLQFCRDQTHCSNITRSRQFRSQPGVPKAVSEVLVYSKNESSVSLRWKPPYPPTGVLKEYRINYSQRPCETVPVTKCHLWPELHCASLSNLEKNKTYAINISAINEGPLCPGKVRSTEASTRKEPPEAPYDLNVTWTEENDAVVEWKHPNVSNGEIKSFTIYIINFATNRRKTQKLQIENERLTYCYAIKASEIFPTTVYGFGVAANNGEEGRFVTRVYTSPPDIPELSGNIEIEAKNETSIVIEVVPKKVRGESQEHTLFLLISEEDRRLPPYPPTDPRSYQAYFKCILNRVPKPINVTIDGTSLPSDCQAVKKSTLERGTSYTVTAVLVNTFGNKTRFRVHSVLYATRRAFVYEYLLLLLLLIPVGVYLTRRKVCRKHDGGSTRTDPIELDDNNGHEEPKEVATVRLDSTIIKISEFHNYIKAVTSTKELKRQHEIVWQRQNTYESVIKGLRLEYIDINYMSGYLLQNVYVATHIPKPCEFSEFWKTVWDENIHHLVLFDNVRILKKQNFESYWPDETKKICCGNFIVESSSCLKFEHHHYRKFVLIHNRKRRQIDQLHFLADTSERLSTLQCIQFFREMSKIPFSSKSPVLVHSSSGLRGNGFVLLCDISIRTARKDDAVDVMTTLLKLTEHTSELIIDYDHYVLSHMVILDVLLHLDTTTKEQVTGAVVKKHLKYLEDTKWLDSIKDNCIRDSNIYFRAVQPTQGGQTLLASYTLDESSTVISAVAIDGYQSCEKFLLVPFPRPTALAHFWGLVAARNISAIFSLSEDMVAWPLEDQLFMKVRDDIFLQFQAKKNFKSYQWITVQLDDKKKKRPVDIFCMKNCPVSTLDISNFVDFSLETNEILKKCDTVLVTCQDGLTFSGLYAAMSYNIQKMKYEGICDICMCVRTIRRQCNLLLNDEEQYKLLMAAAYKYMNEYKYELR